MVWDKFFSNESGKLDHGVGNRVAGSNTIFFIPKKQVPLDWKVTHGRIIWGIRPQKSETHRTRITVGGNIIDYPGELTPPTADITTDKTLIKSTI